MVVLGVAIVDVFSPEDAEQGRGSPEVCALHGAGQQHD